MNKDEILFRARAEKNWVYGFYYVDPKTHNSLMMTSTGPVLVDASSLGRYTGMDDINGTHIFEGDIIYTGTNRYDCSDQYGNRKLYWIVQYTRGSFYLNFLGTFIDAYDSNINDYKKLATTSTYFFNSDHNDYVVVGNKYDMNDMYNIFFDTFFVPAKKRMK